MTASATARKADALSEQPRRSVLAVSSGRRMLGKLAGWPLGARAWAVFRAA